MDRERDQDEERSGFDALADATGMDRSTKPAMPSDRDVEGEEATDEAGGDEKTAVEGAAGLGATYRTWGGTPTHVEGGAGTHVPADQDEHVAGPDERTDASDPRGY